jgi:hypothetical protein
MRQAIDQYTLDKDKPPQSLQDLMNGHYLEEIPMDPFTRKKDWVLEFDRVANCIRHHQTTGVMLYFDS